VLAAFTSAVLLLVVALFMVFGSVERLVTPQPIHYREALVVAVLGLLVNLVCAVILGRAHHGHSHGHDPGHDDHHHGHEHHGQHGHPAAAAAHDDLNLRSAYVHVAADAATSVLAILALLGGWLAGWDWLDPVMGVVGAVLVTLWARGLIGETGKVLLDREMDHPLVQEIRAAVETPQDRITDLHVWRVGRNVYACALTLMSSGSGLDASAVRDRLARHPEVVHSTIEIHLAAPA
jgi:cation diffusion facilitator family transporter